MSTPFYDLASLVVVPSGYKAAKVYAQKPLTTDGQLAFTRASSATRVQSNGLIEKVRTNVLTYSQDFSNANWVGFDVSRTGTQTDPNGGTTASLYTALTNSANVSANFSTASASPYTLSIYIRGASSGVVSLRVDSGSTAAQNNISYTTSWQRFTYTFTAGASTSTLVLGGYASFTTGEGIYVAFAQAELGDIATDYIPTTMAAVSVGPVSGLPRLDYLGSTCPRLLLEPQRTNLSTYSEQFDNASWLKLNGVGGSAPVVTANYGIAPDGTMSADRVQLARTTTAFSYSEIKKDFGTTGTQYTVSVYLKSLSGTPTIAIANDGASFNYLATLTSDWVRYTATFTASGTASAELLLYQQVAATSLTADFLVWGFQAEAGAYATSYIPTLGASVTRVADAASKTGISSLIGQTEGTLFFEGVFGNEAEEMYLFLQNEASSSVENSIYLQRTSSSILLRVWNAASLVVSISGGTFSVGQSIKIAAAYKLNDFVLYVNGVQIGTDTSGAVPLCGRLQLGSFYADSVNNIYIARQANQALLFKTRLTNAQLAELTS